VVRGGGATVNYSGLENLSVNASGGNDRIDIQSTVAGTTLMMNAGDGDDVIVVSSLTSGAGVLSGLASPVNIDAGTGNNFLYVSDAGSTIGNTVFLLPTQIIGTTPIPFTINYTATGGSIGTIILRTSQGGDLVTVHGVPAGTATMLFTEGGNDTTRVVVSGTSAYSNFTVNGGSPTGGATGDVLFVIDVSGTASVVHNLVTSPGAGTAEVLYFSGATSLIAYQDIEQFLSDPDSTRSFLQALARNTLGRNLSPAEVNAWAPVVASQGRAVVANAYASSAEARDRVVRGWFTSYLGRPASPGETAPWVNLLLSGQREEQVLGNFIVTFYAGLDNSNFTATAYLRLLGRNPSQNELLTAVNSTIPQVGRLGLINLLLTGAEFRTAFVVTQYTTLIRQAPSAAEINALVFSPYDLFTLRVILLASDQFFVRGF